MEKLDIKLLLVEDDTVIRNIYKQLLGAEVSEMFVASNGEEGYNSYLENKPDLIVTDIKMPVMNGLDMIRKIREVDKNMRIIIMSAYGESKYFLNAIETGVKGFLIKPVDSGHLKNIINEQAKDILLEKRFESEAKMRKAAEKERDKGESILRALLSLTSIFFDKGINENTLNASLALIGERTNVSRSYIFRLHEHDGEKVLSHTNEWVAEGIEAELNNPELKNLPINDESLKIFKDRMSKGLSVSGTPHDFDEPVRTQLLNQNIKTMLSIPIFIKDSWWGFIGFDDCINKRNWHESESNALNMLAHLLGGALYRKQVEEELKRLNLKLEELVFDRTKELESEVAERANTELLLKDSEEKYRLIYENANDGILLIINNEVVLVNPKVSEIIQVQPRRIIGNRLESFIFPKYHKQIGLFFESVRNTNNNKSQEVQLLNNIWLEMKATSIVWNDEDAFLIFVSDISKRKNAEYKLNLLNKNLEKRIEEEVNRANIQQQLLVQKSKLESIGELSAGLAHEINQPLGGISMGLENILLNMTNDGIDYDYLRSKIDVLFKDIDRIQKIIEHVRVFSRDQDKTILEDVIVNNVIKNTLRLVSRQLRGKNIELIVNLLEEPILIKGNQYRLEQVLLNIISNARYAVEEKEKRQLDSNYAKRITIELSKNIKDTEIVITDNGVGVENSILEKVFNPFFTTKSEEKGTGLGLSISYGIISEMNGYIRIESEVDTYTRVIISLPVN